MLTSSVRRSLVACVAGGLFIVIAALFAPRPLVARLLAAQEPPPPPKTAYYGGWTLNKDLSATSPSEEGRGRGDGGGRRGGGGFGGPGGGGGGGGFGGGFGGRGGGGFGGPGGGGPGGPGGGRGGFDPQKMQEAMAAMREVMTPTNHWVITADGEALTFSDADGRSSHYTANDKKEKHQLAEATIETKTKWTTNGQLHQELSLPGGMKLSRDFSVVDGEVPQLIVTVTPEGGGGGDRGGDRRRPPRRFVYDRDLADAR